MARVVRFERTDPIRIDPTELPVGADGKPKPIFICACGISARFPFCDGSHKACRLETQGHVYAYRPGSTEVVEQRPDAGHA